MLRGLAVLLLFQLVGESLVFLLGVPIPGPVVGFVLLFAALPVLDRLWTRKAANIDLPVISLVVLAIGLMEKDGLITLVGVLLSIVAATVTVFLIYGAASVAGNVAR